MRLRGMKFCTSSARSAPSFIRQPNKPKCTKIVQIARKQKFSVQWGGSGAFVEKNSNATLWHKQLQQLTRFALSVVGQKTVRNAQKYEFMVQWGGSGAFVAKNSNTTSWHELLHHFGPFCTDFVRQPNGPECIQIVQYTPKHEFRVQWGCVRCVRYEKFRRDFVARTFALVRLVVHRVS